MLNGSPPWCLSVWQNRFPMSFLLLPNYIGCLSWRRKAVCTRDPFEVGLKTYLWRWETVARLQCRRQIRSNWPLMHLLNILLSSVRDARDAPTHQLISGRVIRRLWIWHSHHSEWDISSQLILTICFDWALEKRNWAPEVGVIALGWWSGPWSGIF